MNNWTLPLLAMALGWAGFVCTAAAESDQDLFDLTLEQLETMVVTAARKGPVELVQKVPISMTAFNEAQLDALKFKDIGDIAFLVSNANLQTITTQGTAFFSIRGITASSSIISVDPAVGVFVDGVYTWPPSRTRSRTSSSIASGRTEP